MLLAIFKLYLTAHISAMLLIEVPINIEYPRLSRNTTPPPPSLLFPTMLFLNKTKTKIIKTPMKIKQRLHLMNGGCK